MRFFTFCSVTNPTSHVTLILNSDIRRFLLRSSNQNFAASRQEITGTILKVKSKIAKTG